jgi:hypothetical protein
MSPSEQETVGVRNWQEPVAVDAPTYVTPLGGAKERLTVYAI